eukprot:327467_1
MTYIAENQLSPDCSYQDLCSTETSSANDGIEMASETSKNEESDKTNIYLQDIPNKIVTNRNKTVSYYINLAAKSLRVNERLTLIGKGNNINIAVSVLSILQKQHIGRIESMRTGLDLSSMLGHPNHLSMQPTPMITFQIGTGKFGDYINGYQKDKIRKIFEKHAINVNKKRYVTFNTIQSLQFISRFLANEKQIRNVNNFLSKFRHVRKLDLANFIKYSSILIHPLLQDSIFDEILPGIY